MSSIHVVFTLKQQTPMIHFQSDQEGATLRATELKPKFDRYLIEKIFQEKSEYEDYLIPGETSAFDYKVTVSQNISERKEIKRQVLFFGDMGRGNAAYFKENKKPFEVTITTYNKSLREIIERYFASFIFQTNFGTRQSKGFGSFIVLEKEVERLPDPLYKFTTGERTPFGAINHLYRMLRSGINEYRKDTDGKMVSLFYGKSLLWLYARERGWTWDKKAIKQTFYDNEMQKQLRRHHNADVLGFEGEETYLLRDLLGLSSEQDWYTYNRDKLTKEYVGKEEVSRFKSPIIFKPVKTKSGFDIYFWSEPVDELMLGATFAIETKKTKGSLKLSTPDIFDINDYLDFVYRFAKEGRLASHIDERFHVDPPRGASMPGHYRPLAVYAALEHIMNSMERVTS